MNIYAFNAWTTALSYSLSEENIIRSRPGSFHKKSINTNIKQTSPRNWALFVERIHQIENLFKKKIIKTTIAVMSIIISKRPLLPLYLIAAASYFMPTVAAYSPFGSRSDLLSAVDQYCANTFDESTYGWVLAFCFVKTFFTSSISFLCSPRRCRNSLLRQIENWDVSQVTEFKNLFRDKSSCNPDISKWDVSNGQNFVSPAQ